MTCPWCPTTAPTWHALHTHFAAAHVGNPGSAHRKTLGRNGIGGCRSGVRATEHGTLVLVSKRPPVNAPTSTGGLATDGHQPLIAQEDVVSATFAQITRQDYAAGQNHADESVR